MIPPLRRLTWYWHPLFLILGCTVALYGCAWLNGTAVSVSHERTQALLATARANHVSMFGDLPPGASRAYITRTAVSLKQHSFTDVGADFDPNIDTTGRWMVFASTRHNMNPDLYIKGVDGVAVTQLTSDPAPDVQPEFTPDGTHVAFASRRGGNWDIWVIAVGGGPPTQVTSGIADEVHPSWSPDGAKLVFCSLPAQGGQWELWIADAAAGGGKRFIGYGLFPEWSPAGDTIVYQRARERGSRWFSIWTLTLIDGEPRYPTEVGSSAMRAMILPSWSADGKRIAYASASAVFPDPGGTFVSNADEVFDIWVMKADGSGKMRLTDGYTANYAPVFSPDGRVFFASNRSGHDNTWSLLPSAQLTKTWTANAPATPARKDVTTEEAVRMASHNDDL